MMPLARRVWRVFETGYDEAAQEQRSCYERAERGTVAAVAYLIELTGDARWARTDQRDDLSTPPLRCMGSGRGWHRSACRRRAGR